VLLETHAFAAAAVALPVNWEVAPIHNDIVPEIVGFGFTVTVCVAEQPRLFVYVIIDVPAETPVTMPVVETVATEGLAEIQGLVEAGVPLPVNAIVEPTQTLLIPVIVGLTLTVTVIVVVVAH
jgi:hypothetical protein